MSTPANAIARYLIEVDKLYRAGNATEHSYRPALKSLLEALTTDLTITNEPKHIACGAPDYIVTKNGIPLGYIEAKDIKIGLNNKANREQFDRYKQSLGNLIITDYLTFQLFVDGILVVSVTIGNEISGGIASDKKQFPAFLELINQFTAYSGKTIYRSEQLAKMMADKAKLLAEVIQKTLKEKSDNDSLSGQFEGFKEVLMHDLTESGFADIYAQTLAYGLFAARLNQSDNQPFTRYLAPHLIPQSNPFLRKFFNFIAGIELDSRITWIVDALADLFNCVAVDAIKKEFDKAAQDPYIHFYETFLAEYDPALRESRGVYYTPVPVVKFIVQAVDDILKNEFSLPNGLADYSKVKRTVHTADGKNETIEFHKVQILDPATGTGTFLAEIIEKIFSYFAKNKGSWLDYSEKHLIPRLNGFEILMASYAMAHFKLDMILKETGYSFKNAGNGAASRLQVYLTNSLEEPEKVVQYKMPMTQWLTQEANEARRVKKDAPVMVILGNPPYSGESANKTAADFLDAYKREPGGVDKLNEKNSKWINDDYVKFIRYGQNFIEKFGEGVLAYINNHSFLDNPTFRGMRWNLLSTFDKIYILDLHGNSKKKETAPDGSKDVNVFDIQVGVSINLFIKTGKKKSGELAQVYHYDLYGERETKYQFLLENTLNTVNWEILNMEPPQYFLTAKDFSGKEEYEEGFSIQELFLVNGVGIVTARDKFTIHETEQALKQTINEFLSLSDESAREKFNLGKDVRDWSVAGARKDLVPNTLINPNPDFSKIVKISYRPFDIRYTYYTGHSKGFHCMPRGDIMRHFKFDENVGLVVARQCASDWRHIFISKDIAEFNLTGIAGSLGSGYVFPLYLYEDGKRSNNLNKTIVQKISLATGLLFPVELDPDEYKGLYTIDGTPKENRVSIRAYLKREVQKRSFKILGKEEPVRFGSRSVTNLVAFGMSNAVNMKLIRHFGTLLDFALPVCEKKPQEKNLEFEKYLHAISLFLFENKSYSAHFSFGKNDSVWHFISFAINAENEACPTVAPEPNADRGAGKETCKNPPPRIPRETNAVQKTGKETKSRPTVAPEPNADHRAGGIYLQSNPSEKNSQGEKQTIFTPLDLLDYIYAALYSNKYRTQYREFLKIDFPRVPYPSSGEQFRKLSAIGSLLRGLHLMENVHTPPDIATFPITGTGEIEKQVYAENKVWINKTQCFDNVPKEAWEYSIGGYQPAQKWLKDRKGQVLSFDSIEHYRKIIFVLAKTIEIQQQIDEVVE